jgi:hypothetical protein
VPSTATRNLRLEDQATGANAGNWGDRFDNIVARLEDALTGVTRFELSSGTIRLSALAYDADEARNQFIDVAGTLTGPVILVVPDSSKSYDIRKSTSGPATVTVKTNGGSGIVVPQGRTVAARVSSSPSCCARLRPLPRMRWTNGLAGKSGIDQLN